VALVSPTKSYEPARVKLLRDFLADRLAAMIQACATVATEEKQNGHGPRPPRRRPRRG
jgi:hypothetical protein